MTRTAIQRWIPPLLFLCTFPVLISDVQGLIVMWPSVLALGVVLITQRVLVGLLLGGLAGVVLLADGNLLVAGFALFTDHLLPNFQSSWRLGAIAFTLLLGGFAALIEKGKGLETLVNRLIERNPSNARQTFSFSAMGLGFICFFDGLANAMLLGSVTKRLAGRVGVSKVRMAYIVDSTSSAVACLAFISTWISFQLSLIAQGLESVGQPGNPYVLFFQSIPLNFYCLFTLLLLGLSLLYDFLPGSMRRFEMEARARVYAPKGDSDNGSAPAVRTSMIPLLVLVVAIMGAFVGFYALETGEIAVSFSSLAQAFSTSYGAEALVLGSLVGIGAAFCYFPSGQLASGETRTSVFLKGMMTLVKPVLILLAAWVLGSTINGLETADFISKALSDRLPYALLPMAVFLTGAVISFSTGTSWGTMGILMPLSLPAVFIMGEAVGISQGDQMTMLSSCIGAVFSGAVFGDHCSPFSDTTIISSIACGVEPHDHVKTQLPYALIAAGAAIVFGFLPVGYGLPGWAACLFGSGALLLIVSFLKRKTQR